MNYTGYESMWLFLAYSFIGWLIETVAGSVKKHRFVNRGFFTGPFCFVYGFSAVLMAMTLWELENRWFFLFLGCAIQATVIEWITGKILEKLNHHKWWDYSEKKFNFDGYICLQYTVLWGLLGCIAMKYGNHLLAGLFDMVPSLVRKIIIWVLIGAAVIDMIASLAAVFHIKKEIPVVHEWSHRISRWTYNFGEWIVRHVSKRMVKAYPAIEQKAKLPEKKHCFAAGCGFYKLFWLFFIGCILGDLVETVFCRITMGWWMSRSSLVWGPFSIVWGLAMALATALLYKDRDKSDGHLFVFGTLLGGAYEYICSVFTEVVFGKVFWDYSDMAFNLGGRVNLLYCFFWGIAAVIWIKGVYPKLSALIEKMPIKLGYVLSWILIVFMAVNIVVSSLALHRSDARANGDVADSAWEKIIDERFDDERMSRIYPKAVSK